MILILFLMPFQKEQNGGDRTVSGTIFCQEGKGSIPLEGATISLIAGKDTLNTVSDNLGRYSFNFDQVFEITLLAKYQGFEDYCETYQINAGHTAIAIKMNQDKQLLDAAKIKEEIPFVRTEADTTIFNMAALEKMEGDRALNLLLQIPGFSIEGGKLTVWGELIDKTYVNGKLLYGDDPISALHLLKAEEIKNVRVYDTQKMEDIHRGVKNSKKRRVIDVQTFNQFLKAVDLQAQTRGGTLLEKQGYANQLRYSSGVDFNSNSEMQQLGLHANGNNIDNGQNGLEVTKSVMPALCSDYRKIAADCQYVKKWKDAEWGKTFRFDYFHNNDKNTSENETIIDRVATDGGIEPLHYEQTSLSQSRNRHHNVQISTELHETPLKDISISMGVIFDDNESDYAQNILNDSGAAGIQKQEQKSGTQGRAYDFSSGLNWSNPYAKSGWVPRLILSGSVSNNPQHTYTVDTLISSSTRRQLDGNGDNVDKAIFCAFSLKKVLSDSPVITPEVEFISQTIYQNVHRQMMTFDYLLPEGFQTDYMNSYDYSWNNIAQTVSARFTLTSAKVTLISIRAGLADIRQIDVEAFPSDKSIKKNYFAPFVTLGLAPPLGKGMLTLDYSIQDQPPAIELIRERVDNSNPLRLTMGNPALRMPVNHRAVITYIPHISSTGSSFSLQCLLDLTQNPIVDRIQYYSTESMLNAWGVDYSIPAGGTLTVHENAGLASSMWYSASYSCRIKPLKGTLKSELGFRINKSPEYDADYLNCLTSTAPSVKLSLLMTPFKHLRLNLSSQTTYNKCVNDSHALLSEAFIESVSATADLRFLKHAFCDTRYSASLYRYLNGYGIDTDIRELTCALGYYFLGGKLAVSVSGSDMLGKAGNYSTNVTSTEFSRYTSASLGRYCLLNIAYRFSSRK